MFCYPLPDFPLGLGMEHEQSSGIHFIPPKTLCVLSFYVGPGSMRGLGKRKMHVTQRLPSEDLQASASLEDVSPWR